MTALIKSIAACGAVVVLDRLASPLGLARIALDVCAYLALVLVMRAVRVRDTAEFARLAFQNHESAS
jgi:hypothetical protein